MNEENLVLFSWTHFMLSGIQNGIQHGHSVDAMSVKYHSQVPKCDQKDLFWDWATNHKTVNVRNGGDQTALREILGLFQREDNPYPWSYFREDESLNYCMTAISIVLPESVYAWEPNPRIEPIDSGHGYSVVPAVHIEPAPISDFDLEVFRLISKTRFAS